MIDLVEGAIEETEAPVGLDWGEAPALVLPILGASIDTEHRAPVNSVCEPSGRLPAGEQDKTGALALYYAAEVCNPSAVRGDGRGPFSAALAKAPASASHLMSLGPIVGEIAAQPRTPSQRAACSEPKHAPAQKQRNSSSGHRKGVSEEVESNDESHSTSPQQPQPGHIELSGGQPRSLAQCWSIPFPDSSVVGMSPRRFASGGAVGIAQDDGSDADPTEDAAPAAAADLSPPWSPRRVPPAFAWKEGPPRMPGYRSGGASLPEVAPAGYNGHVSAARLVEAASQLQALMDRCAAAGLGPIMRSPPFFASATDGSILSPFEHLRFPASGAAAQRVQPDNPGVLRPDNSRDNVARDLAAITGVPPDSARVVHTAPPESSGATFGICRANPKARGGGGSESSPAMDEDYADEVSSPLTPVHDCRLHLRVSDVSGQANSVDDAAAGAMHGCLPARAPAVRPPNNVRNTAPSKALKADMMTSSSEKRRSSSISDRPCTKRRLF